MTVIEKREAKSKVRKPKAAPKGPTATAGDDARKLALAIAAAGLDKKAAGIEIIDVADKVDYTEMLVLMSGLSDRHVSSIARGIVDEIFDAVIAFRGTAPQNDDMTAVAVKITG